MFKRLSSALSVSLLLTLNLFSQDAQPVSNAFAELKHALDFSKAEAGQTVEFRLLRSIAVKDQIAVPRDSIMKAHVSKVDRDGKHIRVHLVLDSVKVGSADISVQGIIAAVAPAPKLDLASDPHFGMMASNEPIRNDPGKTSATEANAAVNVATQLHHEGGTPINLNEKSQGAMDIEAKLEWDVTTPQPETIIESKGKKLTLETGTQILIRMAPPKMPK
jgi:hypothetical protein